MKVTYIIFHDFPIRVAEITPAAPMEKPARKFPAEFIIRNVIPDNADWVYFSVSLLLLKSENQKISRKNLKPTKFIRL